MTFTAQDVLGRVATLLLDPSNKRWPLVELLNWLNDGLREVSSLAPQAVSKTVVLSLVAGTRQTLPDTATSLLRTFCNATAAGDVVSARGKAITSVDRTMLDAMIPGWQDTATLPFTAEVAHVIDDPDSPRKYMVCPGNTGTGKIEAEVASRHAVLATPGSPTQIASYGTLIVDLDGMHLTAMVNFVMSKALLKDINVPNAAARSQAHYAQYAQSFGIQKVAEKTVNPSADLWRAFKAQQQ